MYKKKNLVVVILASGTSQRIKQSTPKQYFILNKRTLLEINIKKFQAFNFVREIIVVINKNHKDFYSPLKKKYKTVKFINGDNSRQKSSYNALRYLKKSDVSFICIHDAARPFVSNKLIERLYKEIIINKNSVIPVLKASDSIKLCRNNLILKSISRKNIYLSQTPQFFDFKKLINAYENNIEDLVKFSDDSEVFLTNNIKVSTVQGDLNNVKITTINDWNTQKKLHQKSYITKVGLGYDVHRLIKGKSIILFGVKIPFKFKLSGHSDADVGIHAIIDAILGASSLGDIGKQFPDTNKKFKNIKSLDLLKKIKNLIDANGITLCHLDCTLIGEKPKIASYTNLMKKTISNTLKLNLDDISIKATTTEGLGFTGRKEGLACICNATIKKLSFNDE